MTAPSTVKLLGAVTCLAASITQAAAAHGNSAPRGAPEHVSAATLNSYVSKAEDGLVFRSATTDPAARTLVVRREKAGEVEVHDRMNDVIVAREGAARIVLGGRVEGARETKPGEWLGGRIVGGRTYSLRPGDLLWIPAGIPHQMLIAPGRSFTYLAIKSSN